jgi:hypothetical protein
MRGSSTSQSASNGVDALDYGERAGALKARASGQIALDFAD